MGTTTLTSLRNLNFFNVKDFQAPWDGTHSDSTAITNAANAANAAGGGIVLLPGGKGRAKSLPLIPGVYYRGSGKKATVLELEDNANTDLFSAQTNLIDLFMPYGGNVEGTLYNFGISDMTIDGNKSNQSPAKTTFVEGFAYNGAAKYITNGHIGGGGAGTFTWDTANSRLTGTGSDSTMLYNGTKYADGYVQVTMDQAENSGVVARLVSSTQAYILYAFDASAGSTPNTIALYKYNGGWTTLGTHSIAFTRGTQHTIRLDTTGTTITASFDGTALITVTDSAISAAGSFGIAANTTARYYSLTVPTPGVSYPIRFYGYSFLMQNLEIRNGYSGNVLTDWNSLNNFASDSMEGQWSNCKVYGSNGIGVEFGGPHDSQFSNCIFFEEGQHLMHIAPNAYGPQFSQCHWWQPASGNSSVCVLSETANVEMSNCEMESSDTTQMVILGSDTSFMGGYVFGQSPFTCSGFQIGQAGGQTAFAGQNLLADGLTKAAGVIRCKLYTKISSCQGTNGALFIANDGGYSDFNLQIDQSSGSYVTGNFATTTNWNIIGNGLTPTGSTATGGGVYVANNAYGAFTIGDGTHDVYTVNTHALHVDFNNNTYLNMFKFSNYSGLQASINADGNGSAIFAGSLSIGPSGTSPDPGAAGTIATAGVGMAKVTPTAARTGIILAVGTVAGQEVWVVNESTTSGNSLTFNTTPATSHVSNAATAAAINGGTARKFVWDGTFWFPSV